MKKKPQREAFEKLAGEVEADEYEARWDERLNEAAGRKPATERLE